MLSQDRSQERSRGDTWFFALTGQASISADYPASVLVADTEFNGGNARFIAVIPDANNRFERARHGEVGLLEGWHLARAAQDLIIRDQSGTTKTPLIAVVDVTSQAYGRREEAYGIHLALAAAAGGYASARLAGHPVIALLVGKAMSGAFLAHGYQANRIIAIDDPEVLVHAMGKASAARITLRSVEALEALASSVPPMAYDIKNFASLGLVSQLLVLDNPGSPGPADIQLVQQSLRDALKSIAEEASHDLTSRLGAPNRRASLTVRKMLRGQWNKESAMTT
jgi:malonate decarboxylase gamma subunit